MSLLCKILNLGHDCSDPDYDWWQMKTWYPLKWPVRSLVRNTRELAGDGDSVLSLGCGSSPLINMFHSRVVGVDINGGKIDFLKKRTTAELYKMDLTKMEPIGQFDIVLLTDVIEHVGYGNVDTVLSLVSRSLKSPGKAVIATADMGNPLGYLFEKLLNKKIHCSLLFGSDLVERCRKYGLILVGKKSWLWDTAYLFAKE